MNTADPLAGLHPLREPPPVGWWPPAPGWWVLLAVVTICLTAITVFLVRRYRRRAYRRTALQELQRLYNAYRVSGDTRGYIEQLNILLKSVALAAYPQVDVAALHGQQWLEFLNKHSKRPPHFSLEFIQAQYRADMPAFDLDELHNTAKHWIKRHEVAQ